MTQRALPEIRIDPEILGEAMREQHRILMPDAAPLGRALSDSMAIDLVMRYEAIAFDREESEGL